MISCLWMDIKTAKVWNHCDLLEDLFKAVMSTGIKYTNPTLELSGAIHRWKIVPNLSKIINVVLLLTEFNVVEMEVQD